MSDRLFKVQKHTLRTLCLKLKEISIKRCLNLKLQEKQILSQIQELSGVNPFVMDPNELPNDDEELNLYMQLNYKPAIEIAEGGY